MPTGISGREIIGVSRDYAASSALANFIQPALGAGVPPIGGAKMARLGNGAAGIDYGAAFAGSPIGTIGSLPRESRHHGLDGMGDGMGMGINMGGGAPFQADYSALSGRVPGLQQTTMDPTMQALLESLGGGGVDAQQQQDFYRMQLERSVPGYYHQPNSLPYPSVYSGSGVASTHTGYTPAEEYIMKMHAESIVGRHREQYGMGDQGQGSQRKRPTPLDLGIGRVGVQARREVNPADLAMGLRGYKLQGGLVGMSDEEAFHAQNQARAEQQQQVQQQQFDEQQQQQGGHQLHTRSTTLPHQQQQPAQQSNQNSAMVGQGTSATSGPTGRSHQQRHFSHNSLSVSSTTALRTPQHASAPTMGNNNSGIDHQQQARHSKKESAGSDSIPKPAYRTVYGQQQAQRQDALVYDELANSPASSADSPSLISPALTYSSQTHTPSTLSPATPFFGTFNSQTDGFRGAGVVEGAGAKGENGGAVKRETVHGLKARLA